MDGLDDLGAVNPTQIRGGDREVGVTELALDDQRRDPLARHLDRVRVPELMLVPTSAQASLCRPGRYAEGGGKVAAQEGPGPETVGISEVLEETQERVGRLIAARFGVERLGAIDRLLLVGQVGVQIDVGGRDLLVAEP